MSKSRNRSKSEVEHLRGRVRQLEAELKYLKRRQHFFEAPTEEIVEQVEDVRTDKCPACKRGVLIHYDFVHATLSKCSDCDFERRQRK